MGLTLSYELRLPASRTSSEVRALLERIREFALTLPFEHVSPVTSVLSESPAKSPERRRRSWLTMWAGLVAEPMHEDAPPMIGDPDTAQGFLINPGAGCESALFGLLLRGDEAGTVREWYWRSFCKTQYASTTSNEHFLKCHTSLIRLLDFVKTTEIDLIVYDEGNYWETRDERRLLHEVGYMNEIVASLAGRLSDAIGGGHKVEAPIFEHRTFEHLEMGEQLTDESGDPP